MRYRLEEKVGEGGYAEVWRATDLQLRREVAIKLFKPGGSEIARASDQAAALARVDHPNVVRVYDVTVLPHPTEGDERRAVVMELLGGPTLEAILEGPNLLPEDARRLCYGVLDGLGALHADGVIHCDLWSQNIQLDSDGTVRVLDVLYRGTYADNPGAFERARREDIRLLARVLTDILGHTSIDLPFRSFRARVAEQGDVEGVRRELEGVWDARGAGSHPADGGASELRSFTDYTTNVVESGEVLCVNLTFQTMPATTALGADAVAREVKRVVAEHPNRLILGMAFDSTDSALSDNFYGGALEYDPSVGVVMGLDDTRGNWSFERDEDDYLLLATERRTARGIQPVKRWFSVSLVFSDEPNAALARQSMEHEIARLRARGLDINVYVHVGDRSNRATWQQMEAPNGKFMVAHYDASSGATTPLWDWNISHG